MEYRKLIKFGNSSHIVSLPNDWLKKNNLKKGALIYFEENGNGELVLNPDVKKQHIKSECVIEDNGDLKDLHRRLVSNYIAGYDIIKINLKNNKNLTTLKNYLGSLIAFELIDQSGNQVVTKDLLDIHEISIEKIIRRIDVLIRSMMEDTKFSYTMDNFEEIYARDEEINRLTFLGHRILKKCIEVPKLAEKIDLDNNTIIEKWMLISNLEKIGDEVKRISRYLTRLKSKKLKIKEILDVYSEVSSNYIKGVDSYYRKNLKTAYEIASTKHAIIDKCNKLLEKNENPYLFNILDRTKALQTYIRDITRSVYQQRVI